MGSAGTGFASPSDDVQLRRREDRLERPVFGSTRKRRTDRREAWQEVARAVGGKLEQGKRASADTVSVVHDPWTIVLETYTVHTGHASVTYTRAKALFVGQGDPTLRIRKWNLFDGLLERVGLGGASSGRGALAGRYVVKGRPEHRLRSLLTPGLIDTLLAESSVTVRVGKAPRRDRKAHGPQVCQAEVCVSGVVTEPSRLVGLIKIAQEALAALAAVGMAARRRVVVNGGTEQERPGK